MTCKIEDLKNYGKPMSVTIRTIPYWLRCKSLFISIKVMLYHIGLLRLAHFFLAFPGERRRLMNHNYAFIQDKGISNQDFLKMQIQSTAMFSALVKVTRSQMALDIQTQIIKKIGYEFMSNLGPSPEELKATGDAFDTFREWMKALYLANKKAGIHDYKIVEETPDAFQIDITYCVFYAIPADVGLGIACQPGCYCDEIFFPKYCAQIGAHFKRESTIARGAKVCDFRFERISNNCSTV